MSSKSNEFNFRFGGFGGMKWRMRQEEKKARSGGESTIDSVDRTLSFLLFGIPGVTDHHRTIFVDKWNALGGGRGTEVESVGGPERRWFTLRQMSAVRVRLSPTRELSRYR
ncbi:hypothetical protein HAX54_030561, partial [Datura stramonium]|nr:hypothetical protein [Datura stramonium]